MGRRPLTMGQSPDTNHEFPPLVKSSDPRDMPRGNVSAAERHYSTDWRSLLMMLLMMLMVMLMVMVMVMMVRGLLSCLG